MSARTTALSALIACRRQNGWSDGVLKSYIARDRLDRRDAARATYAPMLTKELSPVVWDAPAQYVIDQIRGLIPWPVATAELAGTHFKIYRAEREDGTTDAAPGTILELTKKGLKIACGSGEIVTVTQLQAEGGKRMAAADYFRGHPLRI